MNLSFFGHKSWSVVDLAPPWGNRKSIYWHISNHIQEDVLGLTEGGEVLPDEDLVRGDNAFGWAAGAVDNILGSPAEGRVAEKKVSEVYTSLLKLTKESSDKNLRRLYTLLKEDYIVSLVDQVLQKIISKPFRDTDRLHTVARWLAMESADREVVKFAISILGLFGEDSDLNLLMTLGRHEEFTLFVAVAIQNSDTDVENRLWKLAQHVRGWGRINIVERLAGTSDDYIKDWLLREGYSNEIMTEYTALVCAKTGELHTKLIKGDLDGELVHSAGEILGVLLTRSGPAEGYESYPEGAEAIQAYLTLLAGRENELDALVFAHKVEDFLNQDENFSELSSELKKSWETRRLEMLAAIRRINEQHGWMAKVNEQLGSNDRVKFWIATEAAKVIGIDPWPHYFDRIKNGEDYWWQASQTDQPERMDLLVNHAESTIQLEKIATGPGEELGFGEEFAEHVKLDWLLQELRRFPGKGLRLIRTGLRSPVTRNRNMAVRAAAAIPVAERTEETKRWLSEAYDNEPNNDTKLLIKRGIEGEVLSD